MKNQKSITNIMKVVYLIPLTLIGFSLMQMSACNTDENPVIPIISVPILDSNVFDWEIDTLYTNTSRDFFVADTSNIFIAGNPYSVYKSGNSIRYINHQDNDFGAFCVNGTDINNVYIGGGARFTPRTKLKKWNGISIEDINLPLDSAERIDRVETISANDIWLSTAKNIIYHYQNNTVITYRLDTNLNFGRIYKNSTGNLYCQFLHFSPSTIEVTMYMYGFVNGEWVKICEDTFNEYSYNDEMGHFMGFSENKMLRRGKHSIYYFTGTNWNKYVDFGNNINPVVSAGGNSTDNILFHAENGNSSYTFYYDGKQLYRNHYEVVMSTVPFYIHSDFGRFYMETDYDIGLSFFFIAKLKKLIN